MLSIPLGRRYPPLNLSPAQQRRQTFSALLGQLEGLANQKPLLILFEDAHWADATSLAGKRSGTICSAVGAWFDAQKNVSCGQRAAWNCCVSKAIAIHATPASADPSKANRRFRAFLLPRVGLRRLMITALALSATAIRHHGLTHNQNRATLQTC